MNGGIDYADHFHVEIGDLDGSVQYTFSVPVDVTVLSVVGRAPVEFRVHQNYPNPFNPSTTLSFDIPQSSPVVLTVIYNLIGQVVATVIKETLPAGRYS